MLLADSGRARQAAAVLKNFQESLLALAAEPEEQLRITEPGDVPVDISEDYRLWSSKYLEYFSSEIDPETKKLVEDLLERVVHLPASAFADDNLVSMRQPAWQPLRDLAKNLVNALGWGHERPSPYRYEGHGVYKRP